MKTVLEALRGGTEYLERRGVPEARLNMQLLLAHHLGCTKLDLYLQFDRPMCEKELEPLRQMLRRRGTREPLQHVLGEVEIAGQIFKCDARALIPRPETEELIMRLVEDPPPLEPGDRIVDVGTGSGIIGLSLARAWRRQGLDFLLVDIGDDALSLARENAESLHLKDAVTLVQSDLLGDAPGPYQLIVANLPYIPRETLDTLSPEVHRDPEIALDGGPGGLQVVDRLVAQAAAHLSPGGRILLEVGAGQAEATAALLESGPFGNIAMDADLSGVERFVSASRISLS